MLGLEKNCPICAVSFCSCEHCWRGHKYCSRVCSTEGRRRNRRMTEKRYASTEKGRESNRRRQENFRIRKILKMKIEERVTDHSSEDRTESIERTSNDSHGNTKQCWRCDRPIRKIIGGHCAVLSETQKDYFSFSRYKSKNPHISF